MKERHSHRSPQSAIRSASFLLLFCTVSAFSAPLPVQAMANLRKLRSFRYSLVMSRTELPQISGSFAGSVFLPDTQEQIGSWAGPGLIHTKSRGNIEYSRMETRDSGLGAGLRPDTLWTVDERDEEGSFLSQVERVLALDSFKPKGQDARFQEFSFAPNLPLLDPSLSKRLVGRFRVIKGRNLPAEIGVVSMDKVVSWQVRFSDFDQAPAISFPFVRQWRIGLVADTAVPGPSSLAPGAAPAASPRPLPADPDTVLIRRRLKTMGLESRLSARGDTIVLFLEREVPDDVLQALVQTGSAEVWIGREALFDAKVPAGARKVILGPSPTKGPMTLVLEQRSFSGQDLARVDFSDSAGERTLALALSPKARPEAAKAERLENTGMLWVFTVDGVPLAVGPIGRNSAALRLEPSGLVNLPLVNALAAIVESGPLARPYRIAGKVRIGN